MDKLKIKSELVKENCDWVDFNVNVPKVLYQNGGQLNDESLLIFMCEAESIVNSRPLSVDNIGLSDNLETLTPNHLLNRRLQRCQMLFSRSSI